MIIKYFEDLKNSHLENALLRQDLNKLKQVIDIYKKVETAHNTIRTVNSAKKKCSSKLSNIDKIPELIRQSNQSQSSDNHNNTIPQILRNSGRTQTLGGCSSDLTHSSAKHKMCIPSSNKKNNVLSIAEETFDNSLYLCHYLTPYGCTKQLLKGLDTKLLQFTLVKQTKKTNSYYDIIFHI